jgi:hypothetical protein
MRRIVIVLGLLLACSVAWAQSPLRSVSYTFITSATTNFTFPSGAQAGDLCLIVVASMNNINSYPSGWAVGYSGLSAFYVAGLSLSKLLTSGDISTGHVQFTFSGTGGLIFGADMIGATGGLRETDGGKSTSLIGNVETTANAVSSDYALSFLMARATGPDSIPVGTQQLQVTDGTSCSGALYSGFTLPWPNVGGHYDEPITWGSHQYAPGSVAITIVVEGPWYTRHRSQSQVY